VLEIDGQSAWECSSRTNTHCKAVRRIAYRKVAVHTVTTEIFYPNVATEVHQKALVTLTL
jgi:hypothetical protein